jgi:predicted GH43/DUF377 family glycosyl hydrolase
MEDEKYRRPKPFLRKVVASPEDYESLSGQCEVIGSFNPGAVMVKGSSGNLETRLMVRVAECPIPNLTNFYRDRVFSPYFKYNENKELEIGMDEILYRDISYEGNKEIKLKNGETDRLKHISSQRFMSLDKEGNILERPKKLLALYPLYDFEKNGMEDFRITPFEDGRFILTYVVPDKDYGVSTPFLVTRDFGDYKSLYNGNTSRPVMNGIKDVIVFPEKSPSPSETEVVEKDKPIYVSYTRPNAFHTLSNPGIWVSYSPDLIHWGQNHRLTSPDIKAGSGTPPVKMRDYWVSAYHETTRNEVGEDVYRTKLMRTNYKRPWEGFKTSEVLLKREDYLEYLPERGYVPNVVFTSGITNHDGIVTLYSGIDDTWTVMDKFYEEDLMNFLDKF